MMYGQRSPDRGGGGGATEERSLVRGFSRGGWSAPGALISSVIVALTLFSATIAGIAAQDATPAASPAAMAEFAPDAAAGKTFGLIQKSGDQEYFVDEAQGFREVIEGAGGKVIVQDVQLDANAAINAVDTMISSGVAGIAIVVPDQKIGPAVIEKAEAAGIPLIALDDVIKVGEEAARLWTDSGWGSDGVGALAVEVEALSVCMDRTNASRKMMTDAGFPAENFVQVPYDGTAPAANNAAATVVTANPQFTKWIVFGCNDEGVQGTIRALEAAGVTAENTIAVGLGAYLACPEWKSGNPTGFKAALYISGVDVGQSGAIALLNAAVNDEPLPGKVIARTTMTTPENYEETGVSC